MLFKLGLILFSSTFFLNLSYAECVKDELRECVAEGAYHFEIEENKVQGYIGNLKVELLKESTNGYTILYGFVDTLYVNMVYTKRKTIRGLIGDYNIVEWPLSKDKKTLSGYQKCLKMYGDGY
jgi:hypothetical protein